MDPEFIKTLQENLGNGEPFINPSPLKIYERFGGLDDMLCYVTPLIASKFINESGQLLDKTREMGKMTMSDGDNKHLTAVWDCLLNTPSQGSLERCVAACSLWCLRRAIEDRQDGAPVDCDHKELMKDISLSYPSGNDDDEVLISPPCEKYHKRHSPMVYLDTIGLEYMVSYAPIATMALLEWHWQAGHSINWSIVCDSLARSGRFKNAQELLTFIEPKYAPYKGYIERYLVAGSDK